MLSFLITRNPEGTYIAQAEVLSTDGKTILRRKGERLSVDSVSAGTANAVAADSLASLMVAEKLGAIPAAPVTLASAKEDKVKALTDAFEAMLSAGITVSSTTAPVITARLAADAASQAAFTGLVTHWQEMTMTSSLAAVNAGPGAFLDASGAPVAGTVGQLREMLAAYGAAIISAKIGLAQKIQTVNAATTVAAVNAIV